MNSKSFGSKNIPTGLAMGIGIGMILIILGISLTALLTIKEIVLENTMPYAVVSILIVSSMAGSAMTMKQVPMKRIYASLMYAAVYLFMLILMHIILFQGEFEGFATTAATVLGACVAAALIFGSNKKQIKKKRKYKTR